MNTCSHCGAQLSRLDPTCSFCSASNPGYEKLSAEVEGLIARGQQALQQGRPGDAVDFLAKAVALEPEAFDAYFSLAAAWRGLGNLDRALDSMERARRIRPGNAPIYYNIGMLTAEQGQRYRARWHLWEAFRLVAHDPNLSSKKTFVATIYSALERLGPIADEEMTQIHVARDAEGHPENAELANCLREATGNRTKGLILRVYVAVLRSFLLVPNDGSSGSPDGVLRLAPPGAQLRALMVTGPDKRPWLPAFTDAATLRAFQPGAHVSYSAFPGISIAQMVLSDSHAAGLVLNPGGTTGGGQPLERVGLQAIANGCVVRLQF